MQEDLWCVCTQEGGVTRRGGLPRQPPVPGIDAATATTAGATLRTLLTDTVSKLDVFPHRTGVRVALGAARDLAGVRFPCDVSLHVFGTVTGVVETLVAVLVVAGVRLLSRVSPHVEFQVFQAGKRTGATQNVTLVGFLPRVAAEVGDELVASVKRFLLALAVMPEAAVGDHCRCVSSVEVSHKVREGGEFHVAVVPPTDIGTQSLQICCPFHGVLVAPCPAAVCGGSVAGAGYEEGRRGRGGGGGVNVGDGECDGCQL